MHSNGVVYLRSKLLSRSSVYLGQLKTTYVSYIVMGGEFKKTSIKPNYNYNLQLIRLIFEIIDDFDFQE